jgi:hypothetical protein
MKFIATVFAFFTVSISVLAAIFTNSPSADAFVRSNAPTANYGGAGALSVSGSSATNSTSGAANGIADTFIRFNTFSMRTNLNALYGTNNWVVSSAKLQVTEVGTPNNSIFNQGKGAFEVRWVANTNWVEGTGMPNTPATDGIVFTNETALLDSGSDVSLGLFTNTATSAILQFPLALTAPFISIAQAGDDIGLFLAATEAKTGFTFNARSFGTASARPMLIVSALPRPEVVSLSLTETDAMLSGTNGLAGGSYYVLTSTNIAAPLSQWTPVATNVLSVGGDFTITATNAILPDIGGQQFFILQTR